MTHIDTIFIFITFIIAIGGSIIMFDQSQKEERKREKEQEDREKQETDTIVSELNNMCVIGETFYRHTKTYDNPFIVDENTDYIKIMNIKQNANGKTWIEYCFREYGIENIQRCPKKDFFEMIFEYGYTRNLTQSFMDLIYDYTLTDTYTTFTDTYTLNLHFKTCLAQKLQ